MLLVDFLDKYFFGYFHFLNIGVHRAEAQMDGINQVVPQPKPFLVGEKNTGNGLRVPVNP